MQKTYRFIRDRFSTAADDAAGYLRRRKVARRPFVRLSLHGGRWVTLDPAAAPGGEISEAAAALIAAAGETEAAPSPPGPS